MSLPSSESVAAHEPSDNKGRALGRQEQSFEVDNSSKAVHGVGYWGLSRWFSVNESGMLDLSPNLPP